MSQPNERIRLTIDGVFDIETEAWSRFVVGGLLTRDAGFEAYRHYEEDEFAERLLSYEGTLWAHNGGRYDFLWLLEHARRRQRKVSVYATSSRITYLRSGGLTLRDSAALIPMSLEKAAQIGGARKTSTGLPCRCSARDCGGYCQIRRDMPLSLLHLLEDYLKTDCEATLAALDGLQEYADANDLDLCGTIGQSSWKAAKRILSLPDAAWKTGRQYNQAREAYKGGRVQVFRPSASAGLRYDINSAYPAALASLALPSGDPITLRESKARAAWESGREGLYEASVTVPDCHVPPLPCRLPSGRIAYPTGELQGTWPRNELAYAASLGTRIAIHQAIVFDGEPISLRPFVEPTWELRARAGKATPLGKWLKLYANSLTGKFGQSPEQDRILFGTQDDRRACPRNARCAMVLCGSVCCPHACSGQCGRWTPIDKWGLVWSQSIWRIPQNAHVHWAAYLTAHARIQLHRQLVADGCQGKTAVYCDTDSVYSLGPRLDDIGPDLGQWLCEGEFVNFEALAPKMYGFRDGLGNFKARAKGMTGIDFRGFSTLKRGGAITVDRGVLQLRSALRAESLFTRKVMTRRNLADGIRFGDRELSPSGLTIPQNVETLVAWETSKN